MKLRCKSTLVALVSVAALVCTNASQASPTAIQGALEVKAIYTVFGPSKAPLAVRVARCESRLYARAVSRTGDYGLFQINYQAHKSWVDFRPHRIFDPYYNARIAYRLSRGGTNFYNAWKWSYHCWGR